MSRFRAIVTSLNGVLALLSAGVTILVLFVPDLRLWLSDHGLLGWVAGMAILALAFVAGAWMRHDRTEERNTLQQTIVSAQNQVDALTMETKRLQSELDRQRSVQKDLALAEELLGDIQLGSRFHRYLKHEANFKHLPHWFAHELDMAGERWSLDPRSIETRDLAVAWANQRTKAEQFSTLMTQHLWYQGSEPGASMDRRWLAIPGEWDYQKRDKANDDLEEARVNYSDALDEMFEIMHVLA